MNLYERNMINMSNGIMKRYVKNKYTETEFFDILANSEDYVDFINYFVNLKDAKTITDNTRTIFALRDYYELYHSIVFKANNDICKRKLYNIPDNFLKGLERYDQRIQFTFEFDDIFIILRYDKNKEIEIDDKDYRNTIDVFYNVTKGTSYINFSLLVVPEKYPSVFLYEFDDMDKGIKDICNACNICRKCSMYCKDFVAGIPMYSEELTLRRVPRNLLYTGLSNCRLKYFTTDDKNQEPMFEYPIRNVLDICLHTLHEFVSKESNYKTKDNGRRNRLSVDFDDGVIINDTDCINTVNINLFKEDSKHKTNINETVGHNYPSHHKSPKEHIRRSHYRHYKSGKVVKVSSSIVNRNNKQLKYEIKV